MRIGKSTIFTILVCLAVTGQAREYDRDDALQLSQAAIEYLEQLCFDDEIALLTA